MLFAVFTYLSADRAKDACNDALEHVRSRRTRRKESYSVRFTGHDGTAIYRSDFCPFSAPVPFILVRRAVTSDSAFFLDNEDFSHVRARRFGESGSRSRRGTTRGLPWRTHSTMFTFRVGMCDIVSKSVPRQG